MSLPPSPVSDTNYLAAAHSPNSLAAFNEREELRELNNRLDTVIAKRKNVQNELQAYMDKIEQLKEANVKEKETLRSLFQDQIADLERQLAEAREDSLGIENLHAELVYYKKRSEDESKVNGLLVKDKETWENKLKALEIKHALLERDKKELGEKFDAVQSENARLVDKLQILEQSLNETNATLIETEKKLTVAENQNQSQETLFTEKLRSKEEALFALQVERKKREKELANEYLVALKVELQDLTDHKNEEIAMLTKQLQAHFEASMNALTDKYNAAKDTVASVQKSLVHSQTLEQQAAVEIKSLKAKTLALETRVSGLEKDLLSERSKVESVTVHFETERTGFETILTDKNRELSDLIQINNSLVAEINRYATLLEKEESRLGLPSPARTKRSFGELDNNSSNNATPVASPIFTAPTKRTRVAVSTSSDTNADDDASSTTNSSSRKSTSKSKKTSTTTTTTTSTSTSASATSTSSTSTTAAGVNGHANNDQDGDGDGESSNDNNGIVTLDPITVTKQGALITLRLGANQQGPVPVKLWWLTCTLGDEQASFVFPRKTPALDTNHPTLTIWTGNEDTKGNADFVWNIGTDWISGDNVAHFKLHSETEEIAHIEVIRQPEDELFAKRSENNCIIS